MHRSTPLTDRPRNKPNQPTHRPTHQPTDPLAAHLGLGPSDLKPGRTLDLSKAQLVALLTTTDAALVDALYAFAEASTSACILRWVWWVIGADRRGALNTVDNVRSTNCILIIHPHPPTQAAHFGTRVYARAIVEFSNVCTKDCLYCGIRKHMKARGCGGACFPVSVGGAWLCIRVC